MMGRHQGHYRYTHTHTHTHRSYHSLVYENVNPDPEGATGARYTSRAIRALYSLRSHVLLDHGFLLLPLRVALCVL